MAMKKNDFSTPIDDNDPMLPFMSLLLIIIPVLIGNIAFYHFKVIEVNVPGISKEESTAEKKKKKKKLEIPVILQLKIDTENVSITLLNEDNGKSMEEQVIDNKEEGYGKIDETINNLKKNYKKLDTVLVSVDKKIKYQRLMKILNRFTTVESLGDKKFKLVILPQGDDV